VASSPCTCTLASFVILEVRRKTSKFVVGVEMAENLGPNLSLLLKMAAW